MNDTKEIKELSEWLHPAFSQITASMLSTLFFMSKAYELPLPLIVASFKEFTDLFLEDAIQKAKEEMLDS